MQKPWPRIAQELSERIVSSKLSHKELSEQSGVNYFAIRRMRLRRPTRQSDNAIALCSYFGLIANSANDPPGQRDEIVAAVEETWDGTEAHARLLVELIRSTRQFKVKLQASPESAEAWARPKTRPRRSKR